MGATTVTIASARSWKRMGSLALRLAVVGAITFWLLRGADLGEMWAAVTGLSVAAIVGSFALGGFNVFFAGVRWQALMRAFGASPLPSLAVLVRVFLVGLFYNTFVPGAVGGDVVRGVVSRRHFETAAASYVVVALERMIGLSALGAVFLFGLIFGPRIVDAEAMASWIGALLGLGVIILVAAYLSGRLAKLWGRIPRVERRGELVLAFGLSLCGHATTILVFWLLADSISLDLGLRDFALVVPLALVAAVLPIAVAGVGPREAVLVGLLGLLDVSKADALAISFGYLAVLLGIAGVGGLLQLFGGGAALTSAGDEPAPAP